MRLLRQMQSGSIKSLNYTWNCIRLNFSIDLHHLFNDLGKEKKI